MFAKIAALVIVIIVGVVWMSLGLLNAAVTISVKLSEYEFHYRKHGEF